MRHRIAAMLVLALAVSGVVVTSSSADWRDPACEQDGSPIAGTAACTPPLDRTQAPAGPNSCVGSTLCEATYEELDAAGFDSSDVRAEDEEAVADAALGLTSAFAARRGTMYGGWASFYNYNSKKCNGTVRDSGHCAWLYHKYRVFRNGDPISLPRVTTFPARSGNNRPSDQWRRNLDRSPSASEVRLADRSATITGGGG